MKENGLMLKMQEAEDILQRHNDEDYTHKIALLTNTPLQDRYLLHSFVQEERDIVLNINSDQNDFLYSKQDVASEISGPVHIPW